MRTFIENYLHFMKNCIRPPYEKLKSLKSGFIENSNFENNRDPCLAHNFWILFQQEFFHSKRSSEYFWGHRYLDAKLGAYIFHIIQVLPLPVINNATLGAQQATPVHLIMCPLLVTAGHLLSATMLAQISRMTFPTACYHLV